MQETKNAIMRTGFPVEKPPCTLRNLQSVSALIQPPINGEDTSCTSITLAIDDLVFVWTSLNSGEVFEVESCIDYTLINTNCLGNIQFNWDDDITCCPPLCYSYRATAGSTTGTVNYTDCDGVPHEVELVPSGTGLSVASFCAEPSSVVGTTGVTIDITGFTCT
jgi:hypothetical protein